MMKSKSSEVRTVCILVMVAFDFFWEKGFFGGGPSSYSRGQPCLWMVLLHLASVQLLLRHHPFGQVTLKQSFLRCYLNLGPLQFSLLWVCSVLYEYPLGCQGQTF
jgi:hypothetical protein